MKHICAQSHVMYVIAAVLSLSISTSAFSGTKVAFTGDQGTDDNARAVLNMIANEGVDLVLIQGDLGYDPMAAPAWEKNLNDALGENFPVLSVVGNHENFEWPLYHRYIKERVNRVGGLSCSDNPGVKAHCQFSNIEIVQVSPGIHEIGSVKSEDNYDQYIRDKFSGSANKWRICSWHKNMRDLQTGGKNNSTGWEVYRACLNAGAIVAVAHEHAYSRTHLLSNFENRSVVHRNNDMTIQPGQSFMFVSGLGGRSIREQKRDGEWWASIYTASQGATHGALICDFEQSTASCYFKAIDGSVPDQFTLRLNGQGAPVVASNQSNNTPEQVISATPIQVRLPTVFRRTDSDELRWIDRDVSGQVGSVWIDKECAAALGGFEVTGDWNDLVALAPGVDAIASPCNFDDATPPSPQATDSGGYVFQRTDKNELRWISNTGNGDLGSVRIEDDCAAKLGGASRSGDWFDLVEVAPAMDQISNPCVDGAVSASSAQQPNNSPTASDYVFSRTDKTEMRWISRTASGELGSVRINGTCASNLGGASASGDWHDLIALAPNFDGIPNPCNDDDQISGNASQSNQEVAGYVFKRSDINELRWIARDSSGRMGSVRIDESCAQRYGAPQEVGNWFRLLEVAPGFDTIPNPCIN